MNKSVGLQAITRYSFQYTGSSGKWDCQKQSFSQYWLRDILRKVLGIYRVTSGSQNTVEYHKPIRIACRNDQPLFK